MGINHKCGNGCEHDSDCALHNEPAYENEKCDCSSGKRRMVVDYLREEACRDVPDHLSQKSVILLLRSTADYLEQY